MNSSLFINTIVDNFLKIDYACLTLYSSYDMSANDFIVLIIIIPP